MSGKYGRERPYYGNKAPALRVLESQVMNLADFDDTVGANGFIDVETTLPIGAIPIGWKIDILEGFATTAEFTGDPTALTLTDGGESESDTIVCSTEGHSFVTEGFVIDDTITISGATTTGYNTTYILTDVVAQTLTMAAASFSTTEVGAEGMTIVGTTLATVSVGIADHLARFSADSSQSVAAIGTIGSSVLAAEACDGIGTATTIRVTVAETSDFTEFNTGSLKLSMYYIETI